MRALLLTLIAVLLTTLLSASTEPQPLVVGLEDSKHDFSGEEWSGGDLCVACHAQSSEELPDAPLWNPSADFNRTFGDAVRRNRRRRDREPGNGSLVCMRCHDGTMAKDMFGGLAEPQAVNKRHPALMEASHGGTNHPVGVAYPPFDRWYRPANAVVAEGRVALPNGNVECISCHDPHNDSGLPFMLTKSNERSALCLTCHRK